MLSLLLLPAMLQMVAMFLDEHVYHRRRGLPRWERLGHPIDTLSAALCYGWIWLVSPAYPHALGTYVVLCALSCIVITKDEFVHARLCTAAENWLHSVLFVLHPVVFLGFGVIWRQGLAPWAIGVEFALTLGFLSYQLLYWTVLWPRKLHKSRA